VGSALDARWQKSDTVLDDQQTWTPEENLKRAGIDPENTTASKSERSAARDRTGGDD